MTALENYDRPETAAQTLPEDAYRANVADNLDVALEWVTAHPETEFDFFLPPYSMLFWDKVTREGRVDAVLSAVRQAAETLLPYDNVRLYGYLMDGGHRHGPGQLLRLHPPLRRGLPGDPGHAPGGPGPADGGKPGGDPRRLAGVCGKLSL